MPNITPSREVRARKIKSDQLRISRKELVNKTFTFKFFSWTFHNGFDSNLPLKNAIVQAVIKANVTSVNTIVEQSHANDISKQRFRVHWGLQKGKKTSENEANGDNESTGRWLIDALSILKSN